MPSRTNNVYFEDDIFKIRDMTVSDIGQAALIEKESIPMPWTEKGFLDAINRKENVFIVAVLKDDSVAGYCGMYVSADEGEITNVAVRKDKRRQGIGSHLMSVILYAASLSGVKRAFLEVRDSNIKALDLYRKTGFAVCGRRRDFYRGPSEDAIVMDIDIKET